MQAKPKLIRNDGKNMSFGISLGFFIGRGNVSCMQIEKVFNNNVVLAKTKEQSEMIAMGKGLGFQKKRGDSLDETKIEKKFVIQDDEPAQQLKTVYQDIPIEESDAVFAIVNKAENVLQQTFESNLYLTLADHIHFAIERTKEGYDLRNPLIWEVKKYYPREYGLGKESLDIIHSHTGLMLDKDEAASIALHFVNAQKEGQLMEDTIKITRIVEDVLTIVRLHFGTSFDEDSISYNRFLTHLQYFGQRVILGEQNDVAEDSFLLEQVQINYPKAYACTKKIAAYMEERYRFRISMDEKVYLTIHIQRLVQTK